MTKAPPTPAAEAATRFLVELENTFCSMRVYGEAHPASKRSAEAAATASGQAKPLHVSVTPRGFVLGKSPIDHADLLPLAQRLRGLGLVGLHVESQLTAVEVEALVLSLGEADREHASAKAAVEKIAGATGGRVTAVPLQLEKLQRIEGTSAGETGAGSGGGGVSLADTSVVWEALFSPHGQGSGAAASAGELARLFESALGAAPSRQQWDSMMQTWSQQLAHLNGSQPPDQIPDPGNALADSTSPSGAVNASADPTSAPAGAQGAPRLDAVVSFLQSLSPNLSQRLMAETVSTPAVPANIVMALAQRLPAGIVLGALSAVDRDNATPSQAALALLRKVSAQAGHQVNDQAPPRSNAELAQTAASLEKLLQSNREGEFVPDEYLLRRQQLSREALGGGGPGMIVCPDDQETARHTADLVFQIIGSTESDPLHVLSGLEFTTHRLAEWVRAGDFTRATEALTMAQSLCAHAEEHIAVAARTLLGVRLEVDDLLEGAGHSADRAAAAQMIAQLVCKCDPGTLAALLGSTKLKGTESDVIVVRDALRKVFAAGPDSCLHGLGGMLGNQAPQTLLDALSALDAPQAVAAAQAIVVDAAPAVRGAILQQLFRRNIAWPIELTAAMLADNDIAVRRLALMRLVRDNPPAQAAAYFEAAARGDEYPIDVPVGLAELLRPYRNDPAVRAAYRRWFWSGRRWGVLFSVSFGRRAG